MALPTSYTEQTLRAYMLTSLGSLAGALNLTADSFGEAVNDALSVYGVSAIADATDIQKLRAIARVEALELAKREAALAYDFDADGASYKRSQMAANIDRLLEAAKVEAVRYSSDYAVTTGSMGYTNDPYQWVAASIAENSNDY